jgi:hypothetical protein
VSFRRAFPYLATLFVVLGLFAVFALRPTPFIGLTPEAMADSLDRQLPATSSECEEVGDGRWSCAAKRGDEAGPTIDFDVEINAFGCWTAVPHAGRPAVGTPSTISGCVTLQDH